MRFIVLILTLVACMAIGALAFAQDPANPLLPLVTSWTSNHTLQVVLTLLAVVAWDVLKQHLTIYKGGAAGAVSDGKQIVADVAATIAKPDVANTLKLIQDLTQAAKDAKDAVDSLKSSAVAPSVTVVDTQSRSG